MDDFSSGTSSRSTKLIHGGVRYLQAAVMKLDFEQVFPKFYFFSIKYDYFLFSFSVSDGQRSAFRTCEFIRNRSSFIGAVTDHVTGVPVSYFISNLCFNVMFLFFSWFDLVYYWFGIKAYDFVSGKRVLKKSYAIGKSKALDLFPMLKKDKLVGALIYYDGKVSIFLFYVKCNAF